MTGYQLTLDVGPIPSPGPPSAPEAPLELPPIDAALVCYVCTGRHPVERCPIHTVAVCELCGDDHLTSEHHGQAR